MPLNKNLLVPKSIVFCVCYLDKKYKMLVKELIDSVKDVGEEPQEWMPTQLMDLPSHLLHSIISKVGYRHQKVLRRVSKDMRQLHNDYILHHHETVVRAHRKKSEESIEDQNTRTMLQVSFI